MLQQSDHLPNSIRKQVFRYVILMNHPTSLLPIPDFPCIESQSPLLPNQSLRPPSFDLTVYPSNLPKPFLGSPVPTIPFRLVIRSTEVEPLLIIRPYR